MLNHFRHYIAGRRVVGAPSLELLREFPNWTADCSGDDETEVDQFPIVPDVEQGFVSDTTFGTAATGRRPDKRTGPAFLFGLTSETADSWPMPSIIYLLGGAVITKLESYGGFWWPAKKGVTRPHHDTEFFPLVIQSKLSRGPAGPRLCLLLMPNGEIAQYDGGAEGIQQAYAAQAAFRHPAVLLPAGLPPERRDYLLGRVRERTFEGSYDGTEIGTSVGEVTRVSSPAGDRLHIVGEANSGGKKYRSELVLEEATLAPVDAKHTVNGNIHPARYTGAAEGAFELTTIELLACSLGFEPGYERAVPAIIDGSKRSTVVIRVAGLEQVPDRSGRQGWRVDTDGGVGIRSSYWIDPATRRVLVRRSVYATGMQHWTLTDPA